MSGIADRPGAVIADKYELIELAGRGGMATVWRGVTHGVEGFRRPVAIKRILGELMADDQFVKMFVEEARVYSQLQHPNIVQIHDFGCDDRGYYLVLEWVDGLDLSRQLRSYQGLAELAPWPLIAALTIEVLRGLAAAHERPEGQVIHRDINPQNILIGLNGVVKLTDFGLSWAMDRRRITNPDIVKGKLSYLAPELTLGDPPSVKSDLFSVGIVLWEALAGRKLFAGETDVDVVLGVREADVPPLDEERADLPRPLYAIVHRALEADPTLRYGSADAMARDLARLLRGVDERTDARAVGESVRTAIRRLTKLPPPPPVA
jgi:serine/threonine-protein kinase